MSSVSTQEFGQTALRSRFSPWALLLERICRGLQCGSLVIVLPDGARLQRRGVTAGPDGVMVLHRWRALRRLLLGGDVGGAEAYVDGDWSTPDLTTLVELVARNISTMLHGGRAPLPARLLQRLRHVMQANTLGGSRRNVVRHYDLGNDFYSRWLDRGMSYSAAPYANASMSLEAAQAEKHDRIIELLDVQPGQSVLEIGCGWGGLAERLAAEGCQVTGLTLSPAQLDYARHRLEAGGLSDRVEVRLQDYREVQGRFDRIASIEMLEAVGETWWPTYFRTLRARLKPGGVAVLQVITIAEDRFPSYRSSPDFIQTHIFPGGMLPPASRLHAEIASCGLAVHGVETFGKGYERTLKNWQQRFQSAWPDISAMGFPPRFKRTWEYYLSYCEAGFRAGHIDVGIWRIGHAA